MERKLLCFHCVVIFENQLFYRARIFGRRGDFDFVRYRSVRVGQWGDLPADSHLSCKFEDDLYGERRGIPSVLHPIEWEIWERLELTIFGDRKIRKLGEAWLK